MIITNHFRNNWKLRVGGPIPTPDEVLALIQAAVLVQAPRQLYRKQGEAFEPYVLLAAYWHPEREIVLKIDEQAKEGVAVSVMSAINSRAAKNKTKKHFGKKAGGRVAHNGTRAKRSDDGEAIYGGSIVGY